MKLLIWKFSTVFSFMRHPIYMKYDVTHILTSLKNDVKGTETDI